MNANRVDPLWHYVEFGDSALHIATAEEVQERVDDTGRRRGFKPIGEVVSVVDRDDAMGGQRLVAGTCTDAPTLCE